VKFANPYILSVFIDDGDSNYDAGFSLRKILGTQYEPVGTRFSLIRGNDDNFL